MSEKTTGEVRPSGYETVFITRPEMSDEALKALQDRVSSVVTQYQGEIVLNEDWGKRKLAYPISKETRGHYTYVAYQAKGEVVAEVERNLRLNEHVLRFLSVNLAKEFDAEVFKKARAAAKAAEKKREEEREARREERAAERRAQQQYESEAGGGYGGGYRGRDRGDRGERSEAPSEE